jgi:uncharacterized protein
MGSIDKIAEIVADFDPSRLPVPSPRRTQLPHLPGKADAIIGMRRSGKTWLLFQDIHRLLSTTVAPGQVLYVNFEDERLPDLQAEHLQHFIDAQLRRHPVALERGLHLYMDEVQNVQGWERFVRRILDRGDTQVTLTGSSARLLSSEIGTSLRGRSLATELLPFSFAEALDYAGEAIPTVWPVAEMARVRLRRSIDNYLLMGGFPEVQGLDERLRVRVLQDYVDVVVFRDVVERHKLTNVEALRYLVRRLLSAPAGRFSVNKFYNELRSQGRTVSKDTLYAALSHLEDAYLIAVVGLDDRSEAKRAVNPRKIYPIDPGLAAAYSFSSARNTGHLLETVIYLELRRRGFSCGYGKTSEGFEVDFIARRQGLGDEVLIQVAVHLDEPTTRERELRALMAMMVERGKRCAVLVTLDSMETIETPAGVIRVVPAWQWLLEAD